MVTHPRMNVMNQVWVRQRERVQVMQQVVWVLIQLLQLQMLQKDWIVMYKIGRLGTTTTITAIAAIPTVPVHPVVESALVEFPTFLSTATIAVTTVVILSFEFVVKKFSFICNKLSNMMVSVLSLLLNNGKNQIHLLLLLLL